MDKRQRALLALVACALLWSTGGFLIKSVGLHPLAVSGGRSFFALLFFLLVGGKPKWCNSAAFIGSVLAYACTLTAFAAATILTTAANAILLQYASPVFVCLYEWLFYRERPRRLDIIVILLVLGGLSLFFLDHLSSPEPAGNLAMLGNFLGLLSGASFGLLAVLMKRVQMQEQGPSSVFVFGNLLCVLVALPFLFRTAPGVDALWKLALLGVVQIGLAYLLYTYALSQVTALELILVPIVEPLLNPLWVFLLIGEVPGTNTIVGGAFVLAVVTAWCIWRERQRLRLPARQEDRS
jgi:drug/metabolite transporter (DMT)-like permease